MRRRTPQPLRLPTSSPSRRRPLCLLTSPRQPTPAATPSPRQQPIPVAAVSGTDMSTHQMTIWTRMGRERQSRC